MDPVPYIIACYGIGIALISSYIGFLAIERRYLKRLAASLKESK